jgi:molybdopterin-guanine dinucleotide biosynthesis protein A
VISDGANDQHQKHTKLSRPIIGEFGRNEIAILGTTCDNIKKLAREIISDLSNSYVISYVDADHHSTKTDGGETEISNGAFIEFTDKINFQRVDFKNHLSPFQRRILFNDQDLVIVNGNHFAAQSQIVIIDPVKDLEKKVKKLTDVKLILLKEKSLAIPEFLQKLPGFESIPVLSLDDLNAIQGFVREFVQSRIPQLKGLVLSGGESSRMKTDKGNLNYHGVNQRKYLYELLLKNCSETFISCNQKQAVELKDVLPIIQDTFLNLGPLGGILSAFQIDPNVAWLTVACDLPYLSEKTIEYLVQNRNPSKMATAFLDPEGTFPEPLITIWEPKAYQVLLQFLSLGYSCPRKALINSDIQLLKAPEVKELQNVNYPNEYQEALARLSSASNPAN